MRGSCRAYVALGRRNGSCRGSARARRRFEDSTIRYVILGSLIGLVSGLVPGPFSALVAASGLRSGFWAGFRVAIVPLVTESGIALLSVLLVSRLPDGALRWLGLAGGLFLLYMAKRTWDLAHDMEAAESTGAEAESPGRSMLRAATMAVVSPTPWIFWLVVASPILLGAWRQGWGLAALFVGSFLVGLVGVHVSVAAIAGQGHERLSSPWRRRLMMTAAAGLVLAGGTFLWQSATGDFRSLMGLDELQSVVGDSAS